MTYYNMEVFPIYIPNRNEDDFIRRGYYGGHSDVYVPHGKDLKYYDVNSLYPFVMMSYPMPGGQPVWYSDFEGQDLNDLFGFIEAYVECPSTIDRPFLPYKENEVLRFPTGKWVGIYFSEELKLAKSVGYTIIPLRGYLYEKNEKMESPFKDFVKSLFERRKEAKKRGDEAMSFVYKTLMNSLYGRFGISPKSLVTEICEKDRYDTLLNKTDIEYADNLHNEYYLVRYYVNTESSDDSQWNPPRNSAVQLSAAITAYARIYMYEFISRSDCYYTDTDSVVLKDSLPDSMISSSSLGKFKLEYLVKEGFFIAPKNYSLYDYQDHCITLKHKGSGKDYVDAKWYEEQYVEPERIQIINVKTQFRIDHNQLVIKAYSYDLKLGANISNKREPIYQNIEGVKTWVATKPLYRVNLSGQETLIKLKLSQNENQALKKELLKYHNMYKQKEEEVKQNDKGESKVP